MFGGKFVAATVLAALASWPAPAGAEGGSYTDRRTGCRLWPPEGLPIEGGATAQWSGACKNGLAEGAGTVTLTYAKPNQGLRITNMEGTFINGRLNGKGLVTVTLEGKGGREEGTFVNGRLNGPGRLTIPSMGSSDGEFRDNEMVYGEKVWFKDCNCSDAGAKYVGEFDHGRFNGKGILTNGSGARYEGQWLADRPHGRGTVTQADGTRYSGKWDRGCSYGPDGRLYWFMPLNNCEGLSRETFESRTKGM